MNNFYEYHAKVKDLRNTGTIMCHGIIMANNYSEAAKHLFNYYETNLINMQIEETTAPEGNVYEIDREL